MMTKMKGMSGFRVAKQPKMKGKKMSGFRIAKPQMDTECPVEMFQIVSGLFGKMCVDGTNKRLGLKPCESKPSAHQLFSIHRANDQFLLKNKGECVSGSSLTKGPCETNMVGLSRSGAFHMIKMSGGKCFNARNKNKVNMIKCGNKNRKQHFRFVPVFDAMDSATDVMTGFRVAEEKEFSKKGNKGKKGKKGKTDMEQDDMGDDIGGNFRISSAEGSKKGKTFGGKK